MSLPDPPDPPDNGRPLQIPIETSLDLHAFLPRDIPSVVDEYVRAAQGAGLREIRLIHGRGTGVQRGIVQHVLEEHPLVAEFFDAPESHLGATVAILRRHAHCL
ncbi:MAG TPA: Smr/MutS family protein [Vicinamibacterales bacterium]|nr:Smr/MutS family protein [Vicinamibacterales bacterium]